MTYMRQSPLPISLAGFLLAATAVAQESGQTLEERIRALEASEQAKDARIQQLENASASHAGATQAPDDQVRRGIADLGQTSIFDSTFNPAISLIGDFVFAGTDRDDSFESHNQFLLRDVELGLVGRVDPSLSYQVYVHFSEEEIELEEAYVFADDLLPGTFQLKAGRYNLDFGKLSPIHDHDLPFVDKPQVLQEYLGGTLRGTGLELHHYFELGETSLLRWSAGISNSLDGDSHAVFGPASEHGHGDEDGPEPFGEREIENFAFHGRVASLSDAGENGTLQFGASAAWAPEARSFFDSGSGTIAADFESLIVGVDATYKNVDSETGAGFHIGGEFLLADTESSEDGLMLADNESNGFYGYVERLQSKNWSFGASGGFYEHAEDDAEESWDAGVFATHRVNEFNRLRLEVRHFDDPMEDSIGVLLQWTVILGSHGHGVDW